jgi:hypothetical protein
MSDHLNAIKSIKNNQANKVSKNNNDDDNEEEVRLAPKKVPVVPTSLVKESKPIPSREFEAPKPAV